MNTTLSQQETTVTTSVLVSQNELNIIRQHAWQNGVKIHVKQTVDGPILTAPTVYLAITGFLDEDDTIIINQVYPQSLTN